MKLEIEIPDEDIEKIKALTEVRKGLEKTSEIVKTQGIINSFNIINGEINTIVLTAAYKNEELKALV